MWKKESKEVSEHILKQEKTRAQQYIMRIIKRIYSILKTINK